MIVVVRLTHEKTFFFFGFQRAACEAMKKKTDIFRWVSTRYFFPMAKRRSFKAFSNVLSRARAAKKKENQSIIPRQLIWRLFPEKREKFSRNLQIR
jgi:hypothetical protein